MSTKQNNISYICLYYSYLCMFDRLSDKELGEVINALLDYAEKGTKPEFEGGKRGAFMSMVHRIKIDERKYQERCRKKGGKKSEES